MNDTQTSIAEEPVGSPRQSGKNSHIRILVVDDDDNIRNLNVLTLSSSGYLVDEAENGAVAWDSIHLNRYDLVVTDNNMPKLSGLDLLKQMRDSRIGIPVIMATGKLPTEEFSRNPRLKPFATLLKPYTRTELLGSVEKVLRQCGDEATRE